MSVHLIYGDSFLATEALNEHRAKVGPPELLEANSHIYAFDQINLESLKSVCNAVPFLAQSRLVVVEGLLSACERGLAKGRREDGDTPPIRKKWKGLREYLNEMPVTTLLIFLDGSLRNNNSMLIDLRPLARIQKCVVPRGQELSRWIRDRAEMKGARISAGGLRLLAQYIGENLWVLDSELEKLALYAVNRVIEEEDVKMLVSQVREASIFPAVDAILEGEPSLALQTLHRLRAEGANLPYILSMITRQLRLTTLAKDILDQGVPSSDIGSRLGIRSKFVIEKTLDQARKFQWARLIFLYQRLLKTDLEVKEGRLKEDLALDLFIAEVAVTRLSRTNARKTK